MASLFGISCGQRRVERIEPFELKATTTLEQLAKHLKTDNKNCGFCDNDCTSQGKRCENGVCVCWIGYIMCNGICVNPTNDKNNCNRCGNACPDYYSGPYKECPRACRGSVCGFYDVNGDFHFHCEWYAGLPD
jgi:hypothetical protein